MIKANITISGSRDYNDYTFFSARMNEVIDDLGPENIVRIISGGANGVDKMAERYAKENGYTFVLVRPDYRQYAPKVAPLMRNEEMVIMSNIVIAFWNKKSRGTKYTITYAAKMNRWIKVFYV